MTEEAEDVFLLCYQPHPDFEPFYLTSHGGMRRDPREGKRFSHPNVAEAYRREHGYVNLKVVVISLPA